MTRKPKPRAMTAEEMRSLFFEHLLSIMNFWLNASLDRPELKAQGEMRYRMEGFVHSMLAMFDGVEPGITALNIVPAPHPDDHQFHVDAGTNWWQSGMIINECQLHDLWSELRDTIPENGAEQNTTLPAELTDAEIRVARRAFRLEIEELIGLVHDCDDWMNFGQRLEGAMPTEVRAARARITAAIKAREGKPDGK